jgi:glycolate oxidase iron-sulfur subunit
MSILPTDQEVSDPQGDAGVKACVRYGFCVTVCPTYQILNAEQDSPRGRIALIKEMFETGGSPAPSTVHHLDRCLSCSACMSPCAAGVDYRSIIDDARAYIEQHFSRPLVERIQRALILHGLTRPQLSRVLLRMASLVPTRLVPWLSGRFRPFVETAHRVRPAWKRGTGTAAKAMPRPGEKISFLLEGCVQQVVAPRIDDAAERLLERNGMPVVRSASAQCCGALALHMGRPDLARRQARKLVEEVHSHGIDNIAGVLSTATGCLAVLKEYDRLFEGTPDEAAAAAISRLATDPVDIVRTFNNLAARDGVKFSVAMHEPCSLRLLQHGDKAHLATLSNIGLRASAVPDAHMCCGSAGSYSLLQPEISEELGRRRAAQIAGLNADVVVTANIGCLMQLDRFMTQRPIHVIELLDWMNGGPEPPELRGWQQWKVPQRQVQSIAESGVW